MTTFGYDYAWYRPPNVGWLRQTGASFVCRYVVPGNSKSLSRGEAVELAGEGMAILSNYEGDGHYEVLAGYASGQRCAAAGAQQHFACGGPKGAAIVLSCDFDAQPGQYEAYYQGARAELDSLGLRTGAYAGYHVIKALFDAGIIHVGWQAYAWSGGQWDPRAQVRQVLNGGQYDHDETLTDFASAGMWGAAVPAGTGTPVPVPAPSPSPVRQPAAPYSPEAGMIAHDPKTGGFWIVRPDGAVFSYGGAVYHGGANQHADWQVGPGKPNGPCVGIAADGNGGYWLASDPGTGPGPHPWAFPA